MTELGLYRSLYGSADTEEIVPGRKALARSREVLGQEVAGLRDGTVDPRASYADPPSPR